MLNKKKKRFIPRKRSPTTFKIVKDRYNLKNQTTESNIFKGNKNNWFTMNTKKVERKISNLKKK